MKKILSALLSVIMTFSAGIAVFADKSVNVNDSSVVSEISIDNADIDANSLKTASATVYNMNNFSIYNRSKEQIVKKYSQSVPSNYSANIYSSEGSAKNTYKESVLNSEAKTNAVKFANYTRWLGGYTGLSSSNNDVWTRASKGAILIASSSFSHTPSKPTGMSSAFYNDAYKATSTSSIAYASWLTKMDKFVGNVRMLMNDDNFTVPSHRNTFTCRNATKIAYGSFGVYTVQTVEYAGKANPSGTANSNNEMAYAWPSPGNFPVQELSTKAPWSLNLNTDKIKVASGGAVVEITDLSNNKKFTRKSGSGLYTSTSWGYYLSFAPPTSDTYSGKNYKVKVSNLVDARGKSATLEYTVNFFSYVGNYTIDGVNYNCDDNGKLTKTANQPTQTPITTPKVQKLDKFTSTTNAVRINWNKVENATGYRVYRYDNTTKKWTLVSTIRNGDTTYRNGKLSVGVQYQYRVRAYKKVNGVNYWGDYSDIIKTATRPSTMAIRKANRGSTSVRLFWNETSSDGYNVQQYDASTKTWKTVKTVNSSTRELKISGLKRKTTYKFRIRAFKDSGNRRTYSAWSKSYNVKTK